MSREELEDVADQEDAELALAELDHFEGGGDGHEYGEFAILDPETRSVKSIPHYPYAKKKDLPDGISRADVCWIVYDTETDEILAAEYDDEETKKQSAANAKKLLDLQDDDVVTDSDN